MNSTRSIRYKNAILIVLAGGIICGVTAGAFLALTRDLPQIRSLENFHPSAITRIYSADDVLLAEFFAEKSVAVKNLSHQRFAGRDVTVLLNPRRANRLPSALFYALFDLLVYIGIVLFRIFVKLRLTLAEIVVGVFFHILQN